MEQFKLRMWNPSSNSYLYDIDNVFECLKQQHKFDGTMPDRGFIAEWDHKSEGMKWEMYTGQFDKHKKEIFQGDLVSDGELIFEVEWNRNQTAFCINPRSKVNGKFLLFEMVNYGKLGNGYFRREDLLIVGNVNENPELL